MDIGVTHCPETLNVLKSKLAGKEKITKYRLFFFADGMLEGKIIVEKLPNEKKVLI